MRPTVLYGHPLRSQGRACSTALSTDSNSNFYRPQNTQPLSGPMLNDANPNRLFNQDPNFNLLGFSQRYQSMQNSRTPIKQKLLLIK